MAANGTNQSTLSQQTRPVYDNSLNNQRAQAYTRNPSPNTPYNQGANTTMFSQMYNPSYGYGQQPGLGRYTPPMMNPNARGFGNQYSWMNQGGYGYNTPEAYTAYPGMGQQQGQDTSGFFDFLRNMFGQQGAGGQQPGGMRPNAGMNRGGGFGAFLEQGMGNRGGGFGPQPTMPGAAETMRGGGFGPQPEMMSRQPPTMMGGQSIGGATRPPQNGGANNPWMSNTPQQASPQIFGALPWMGGTPYQQVPGG